MVLSNFSFTLIYIFLREVKASPTVFPHNRQGVKHLASFCIFIMLSLTYLHKRNLQSRH